ncbi:hypothetical protein EV130_1268 [Rhizobium azibense]|uniref:Uncharacterized protein n=1 Tax=Rhizobium azibense TaxID=1136135 RepID=A0A4R3Q4V4_9HYPH|nr:hypothetical protein EV130_1268 [Rhizobium azibense]
MSLARALGKQAKIGTFCLFSPNLTGVKEPNSGIC